MLQLISRVRAGVYNALFEKYSELHFLSYYRDRDPEYYERRLHISKETTFNGVGPLASANLQRGITVYDDGRNAELYKKIETLGYETELCVWMLSGESIHLCLLRHDVNSDGIDKLGFHSPISIWKEKRICASGLVEEVIDEWLSK